jgi:hypothetical protein
MVHQLRKRIDKWNYLKLKSFCTAKEMATKLKRLPTEWEKKIANYTSHKGLITLVRAQKIKFPHKINDSMKKWAHELNRNFSKEEVQMAQRK